MLLSPFYPVEMVRVSSRVTTNLFPYFYHFWFAKKMPLHFHVITDEREREHTSVRVGKSIHLSSSRNRHLLVV